MTSSTVHFDVIIPLVSLLAGSLLTYGLESLRHRRSRREEIQDSRRLERAQAYVDFLDSAHEAAHLLGRSTKGCPSPLDNPSESYWLIDSAVTRKLRVIQLLGSDPVVASARAVRSALTEFRRSITAEDMTYASDEYWSAHRPVADARDALIRNARDDLHVELPTTTRGRAVSVPS